LLAVLMGSVIQKNGNTAMRADSPGILTVSSAPH